MRKRVLFSLVMLCAWVQARAYDFYGVSNGDTLYYTITESSSWTGGGYTYVAVTFPGPSVYDDAIGDYDRWGNHTRPQGNVVIPNTVSYNGTTCQVRAIGQYAFAGCKDVTSVSIPSNVKTIEPGAFQDCGILSLTVPNTVTSMYNSALVGIPNVVYNGVASGTPWGACMHNGYVSGDYVYANSSRTTLKGARRSITTADIPSTVTRIDNAAFSRCFDLQEVTIPSSVTSIGQRAFGFDTSLSEVTIPGSVRTIDFGAFADCRNLGEVHLNQGLLRIGAYAFSKCALRRVGLPEGLRTLDYSVFMYCDSLRSLSIPNTVDSIGMQLVDGCANIDTIIFDVSNASTSSVPSGAFDFLNLPDGASPAITLVVGPHVASIPNVRHYEGYNQVNSWLFYGMDDYIGNVVMQGAVPPTCGASPCSGNGADLFVPCSARSAYESSIWGCFGSIVSYERFTASASAGDAHGTVSSTLECDTLTVSASPAYGYDFDTWSDGDRQAVRTLALTGDTTLVATFTRHRFNVTATSGNSDFGSVDVSGSGLYLDTVTLTAIAEPDYHFSKWSDGNSDNPRLLVVSGNISLTASFVVDSFDIAVRTTNTTFGSVSGQGRYETGAIATIQATANSGYAFSHWNDLNNDNPRQIAVTQDTVFDAFFVMIRTDTLFVHDTVEVGVPYAVHDTVTEYVPVHDTTVVTDTLRQTVIIHDTTLLTLTDTVTMTEYVFDTTYITLHDTVLVNKYIYDTTYLTMWDTIVLNVHDTTIVNNHVHDTTLMTLTDTIITTEYVFDTAYITLHDTVLLSVHDTTVVHDYIYRTNFVYSYIHDTIIVDNYVYDTAYINRFIHDTVLVNRYIYDSTYIDRIVHDTVLVNRYIYDTTYLTMWDTVVLNVHDTTIVNNYIHDTTLLTLTDTVTMTEYVFDTTYITLHDTIIQDVYIHDTTQLTLTDTVTFTEYVYDTTYVTLRDTITQDVYIHDTTFLLQHDTTYVYNHIFDTVYVDHYIFDTSYVDHYVYDTTYLWQHDTLTLIYTDTVDRFVYDTVLLLDTIWTTDTIWLHDTIFIHDTIYINTQDIDEVGGPDVKLFSHNGRIVVEGIKGEDVYLFDVVGRRLAARRDEYGTIVFDVPTSGAYLVKVGNTAAKRIVVIR